MPQNIWLKVKGLKPTRIQLSCSQSPLPIIHSFVCLYQLLPLTPIQPHLWNSLPLALPLPPRQKAMISPLLLSGSRGQLALWPLNSILYSVASPSEDVHKCPEELSFTCVPLTRGFWFFSELLDLTAYNPFVKLSLRLLSTCSNPTYIKRQ